MNDNTVLLELAKLGALERFIEIRTKDLGKLLGTSQQSASIYLNRLGSENLIKRVRKKKGSSVRITDEGMDRLLGFYEQLRSIFEVTRIIKVHGSISKGLGEGAYYLSQEPYKKQLRELFDMDPFEGTLNIEISKRDLPALDLLRKGGGTMIEGFQLDGRSFGSCLCYSCKVNGVHSVIMIPNRTLHINTLEIVSGVKLRDALSLVDGDEVTLEIEYPARNGNREE